LLESTGLPPAFAGLEPDPARRLPGPGAPEVEAAVARAATSTVKVLGTGCGRVQTGSGFVAASGLVVTNAHVVAGVDAPRVESRPGRSSATPVLFDPDLDVAVLRVEQLDARPSPLLSTEVGRGARAAAIGYPGGGPLRAAPAVVLAQYDALGRDIYSRGLTRRPVYELQAQVRAGNSGGPVVDPEGRIIGVVFSRSASHANIGFAITAPPVVERLRRAQATTARVSTGPCML
jgi:S1-C subfamily serine protease